MREANSLTMLEAALGYAKHGWYVFPCKKDKTPYIEGGVLSASTKASEIEAWWQKWPRANIGVDVGRSGFMVLDLDPGHDMAQLEAKIGKVPETQLWQQTPRGGKHLFFELYEGEIVPPSASKLAPHVDVRSFHSYVLVAPSVTDDGEYTLHGDPSKAAYRTDAMLEAARAGARNKSATRDTWIIEPDLPENIERATKWLKEEAKPAIEGATDQTTTAYSTAAMLRSFGLTPETALDLMLDHWNPRCIPPWGEDAVEHFTSRIENAYRYSTSDPGNMTPAYHEAKRAQKFKPVRVESVASGMEWTAGRFRFVDRQGIKSIQPPEWIIDGLLPKDAYAMLFGAPGTFKTFVALDIALAIAAEEGTNGTSVWADKIIASGPVLFTAGEGRSGIARRIQAWEQTHTWGAEVDRLVLGDPVPLISEELEPFIAGAKQFHDQYALVVIDTIGRAMQGADENAQKEASKFTALVERIRRELGASVLALHHTGHGATDRERGSTVFGADADVRLRLERVEKEYAVTLSVVKQKDAEEGNPSKIELRKVNTSLGGDSLVCVKPEATRYEPGRKPEIEGKGKSKFDPTKHEDGEVFAKLDAAIKEEFAASRGAFWTQSQLVEILLKRPMDGASEDESVKAQFNVDDKTMHKWLKKLRQTPGTYASSVYHPKAKAAHRWHSKTDPSK